MLAPEDRVEVELRSVQRGNADDRAVVIVAPRNPAHGCPLWIDVGDREARALTCELQGEETSRTQALVLSSRIAQVLQGNLVGGVLIRCATGFLKAAIQIRTPDGLIEVPTEPGHALAAAAWLHRPLLADRKLFDTPASRPTPITGSLADFLVSLDLNDLGGGERRAS
jgi:bifunctional DNase/RNase